MRVNSGTAVPTWVTGLALLVLLFHPVHSWSLGHKQSPSDIQRIQDSEARWKGFDSHADYLDAKKAGVLDGKQWQKRKEQLAAEKLKRERQELVDQDRKLRLSDPYAKLALEVLNYTSAGDKNATDWKIIDLKKCIFETRKFIHSNNSLLSLVAKRQVLHLNNVVRTSMKFGVKHEITNDFKLLSCPYVSLQGDEAIVVSQGKDEKFLTWYNCGADETRLRRAWKLMFQQVCRGVKSSF